MIIAVATTSADERLLERWLSPAGEALVEQVLSWLLAGHALADLGGVGTHDGRVDLRCLPAGPAAQETFRGVTLTDLDLSGASLPQYRFDGATLTNCVLDAADCSGWRMSNTHVADCSFQRADLRSAVLGSWQAGLRNTWNRTNFVQADLRHATSVAALYEGCDFTRAKLTGVQFQQCGLTDCRFAGRLRNVTFDGRQLPDGPEPLPMRDVDFTGAIFDGVSFRGLLLDSVTLPDDDDLSVLRDFGSIVRIALAELDGDESVQALMLRGQLTNWLRMARAEREDEVFNRRDYLTGKAGSEGFAAFVLDRLGRAASQG